MKKMSDKAIFDKYIDLDRLCLTESEKKQVMDMLYKYKEAFSLRDKISTCANIEVEIEFTYKSSFLLDHIMLRRKIK